MVGCTRQNKIFPGVSTGMHYFFHFYSRRSQRGKNSRHAAHSKRRSIIFVTITVSSVTALLGRLLRTVSVKMHSIFYSRDEISVFFLVVSSSFEPFPPLPVSLLPRGFSWCVCVVASVLFWYWVPQSMPESAFDYPTKVWHFPLSARAEVLRRVRYCKILCHAIIDHVIPCHAIPYHFILYRTIPYHTI